MVPAAFDRPVLSNRNLRDLYALGQRVEEVMPKAPGVAADGPFDVELGFQNDKIWLFQIRPFVENSKAQSSEYLLSISPRSGRGSTSTLPRRSNVVRRAKVRTTHAA